MILVYDVSRWGRFQNPDQAAHYEFLCEEAGVRIEYCAETFANDGTTSSIILKTLKRVMAAEYSRDLSDKVSRAQRSLSAAGFWQGGPPGYGLRRKQVFAGGKEGRALVEGDRKGPHCGRTILVHGPSEEVVAVRRIFDLYVNAKVSVRSIPGILEREGFRAPSDHWREHLVHDILKNEKYAGANVIAKTRRRLGEKSVRQPSESWIRTPGAFEPIVSKKIFDEAQARRIGLRRRFTDDELLAGLVRLHKSHGRICARLIDQCPDLPSSQLYGVRFGSMLTAYERAGIALIWRHRLGAEVLNRARRRTSRTNSICGLASDEIVAQVKDLLAREGRLTRHIIEQAFGRGAYGAAVYRIGSGRRLYAMAGYIPNAHQNRVFDNSPAETLTSQDAEVIRLAHHDR